MEEDKEPGSNKKLNHALFLYHYSLSCYWRSCCNEELVVVVLAQTPQLTLHRPAIGHGLSRRGVVRR